MRTAMSMREVYDFVLAMDRAVIPLHCVRKADPDL